MALAISTSGGSAERRRGAGARRGALGLRTIALTGRDGGEVGRAADIHVNVPSPSTARVQEVHRTLLHVICELVENAVCRLTLRTETMTVNMGPQHPSTHGVLRLVLELDGETVLSASPTIGYLHTGIEKTAEQKKWQQVIPLVERMDYLSAQSNSMAFCLSVEKLLGLEVPERVQHDPRC